MAQSGARLADLIFVGLPISLNHILKADDYLSGAFAALFVQFELHAIGVVGFIPDWPPILTGLELIAISVALFAAITVLAIEIPQRLEK